MIEMFVSFLVFLFVIAAMSLGLLRGKRVEGSCGGLNNIPGVEPDCGGACRRPCKRRQKNPSIRTAIETNGDRNA